MQCSQKAAIDLPQKMLIWTDADDKIWLRYSAVLIDGAWFDYKTYDDFWLRTSLSDFFQGYVDHISSLLFNRQEISFMKIAESR